MASIVTYLLVSNPGDAEAVRSHSIVEEHGFELQEEFEGEDGIQALRFVVRSALEEHVDVEAPGRQLSSDFPEAAVIVYEIEERFNQVEHLTSMVFIDGEASGEVEHGYVLNVGS